jgi:hypothetical protein
METCAIKYYLSTVSICEKLPTITNLPLYTGFSKLNTPQVPKNPTNKSFAPWRKVLIPILNLSPKYSYN